MNWTEKIVVITGASTGIGQATKELLRDKGCIVYNLDLSASGAEDPYFIKCDVRSKEDIANAISGIMLAHNKIDMVFANAGIHLFAGIEDTEDEQLDSIIRTNIYGVFYLLKAVLPVMKAQRGGSVVLMGSDQSFIGKASSAAYGMTKGAIGQLTKSTAIDYAPFGLRVNCICPGTVDTPLLDKAVKRYSSISGVPEDQVFDGLKLAQPLPRIAQPVEIARTVAFLLSDESSFTTGALISVDGGYVCQ